MQHVWVISDEYRDFCFGNLKKTDDLHVTGVVGRILLVWIFGKRGRGLNWMAGYCELGNECSGPIILERIPY
jgi:hypothetical protein